jgi:hypothetical protein
MAKVKKASYNWQLYVTLTILGLLILPITLLSINAQNNIQSDAASIESSTVVTYLQEQGSEANSPATVNYSIQTTGIIPVSSLVISVRDANNQRYDFPARNNVPLSENQSFVNSRSFPSGEYTYWVTYYANNTWNELTPTKLFTIR